MPRSLMLPPVLVLALTGCVDHPMAVPPHQQLQESLHYFPQSVEKEIDLLFVIDNSLSMKEEQDNLAKNFPRLIEALRSPKLGPDGSGKLCHPDNASGCKIPDVQIGVVSTDVGVGLTNNPHCSQNGDGGVLQSTPRGGCIPPSDPYIRYVDGVTNVNDPATVEPVEQVKQAFSCIARLGTDGCGYEHPLEAARRGLDSKINPGFLRPEAFLAVVFITDEDDCSAQNPQLFGGGVEDPFGFRCFEHGIRCNIDDPTKPGPRTGCKPLDGGDPGTQMLRPVQDYIDALKRLKPPGRVIVSAIAGPPQPVTVVQVDGAPVLDASCKSSQGKAAPAIRLKTVVDAFGNRGHFSQICTEDFGPALERLGELIVASLGGQCISAPPLTPNGGLACHQGDVVGAAGDQSATCQRSCLDRIDCIVELVTHQGTANERTELLQRCEPAAFADPANRNCGDRCPCWRVVPKPAECRPEQAGSPYGLEILRKGEAEKGSVALARCATSSAPWGGPELARMPQCN